MFRRRSCLLQRIALVGAVAACAPAVAQAREPCRVIARVSAPRSEILRVLGHDSLAELRGHRVADGFTFLPRAAYGQRAELVHVGRDGRVRGGSLSRVYGNAFAVAGTLPSAQLLVLRTLGGTAATAAVCDPARNTTGAPRALLDGARGTEAVATPARDGLRSVFAIGGGARGPLDVGVVGVDAQLAAPATQLCEPGKKCTCAQVLATDAGGAVSFFEEDPSSAALDARWRVATVSPTGEIVAEASAVVPVSYSCPLVAHTRAGLVGLFSTLERGLALVRHAQPSQVSDIRGPAGVPLSGIAGDGDDLLLVDGPSVLRANDGRELDESSRLRFEGARDVALIPSDGDGMRLSYSTASSLEIVHVTCH